MNSIFDTNLRLFKTSSVNSVEWSNEVQDLKLLVLALLADSQQDLLISSALSTLTTDDLREMTEIEIITEAHSYEGIEYDVDTIIISFPQDFFRQQSITFVSTNTRGGRNYNNSLILIKCFPKLQSLIFHWLKNKYGLVIRSLRFSSPFIMDTLKFTVDGLVDQSRLGDIELQFQTKTELNALSAITIDIPNRDILEFVKLLREEGSPSLLEMLYEYLQTQTSIDFHKLNISRLRCNFIMITFDGKLKFNRGLPKLEKSDEIRFTMWDFIHRIYETI